MVNFQPIFGAARQQVVESDFGRSLAQAETVEATKAGDALRRSALIPPKGEKFGKIPWKIRIYHQNPMMKFEIWRFFLPRKNWHLIKPLWDLKMINMDLTVRRCRMKWSHSEKRRSILNSCGRWKLRFRTKFGFGGFQVPRELVIRKLWNHGMEVHGCIVTRVGWKWFTEKTLWVSAATRNKDVTMVM